MKLPDEYLKQWSHPAVFAIWTGFLIYQLVSRKYVAFLRPEFGLLLAVALFVALGFMIAAVTHPQKTGMGVPAILRALVLLVPVLYSMAMPDTMLGHQAFKKRFIGTNNGAISRQIPSWLSFERPASKPNFRQTPGEIEGTQQARPQERTILDIYRDPNMYIGQRVVFTGMIVHDEQFKQYFGGRDAAVYRFLINCCAADAIPLAIALDSDQADTFENDQWVQVEGIFELQQVNGKAVPMVLESRINPIEAPAVPYLF